MELRKRRLILQRGDKSKGGGKRECILVYSHDLGQHSGTRKSLHLNKLL